MAAAAACAAAILLHGGALAQKPEAAAPKAAPEAADALYVPPLRGAPQRRVGGASRGIDGKLPSVFVLVPDHTGLTTVEQPVLYWYISAPTRVRVEVALVDERKVKPLVEVLVPAVAAPGFHRLRLAEHGVRLEEGVDYQWSVALVPDAGERSNDVISGGVIQRVARPQAVQAALAAASGAARVTVLARAGLWYDAIAEVSAQLEAAPADRGLHELRARMLEQVGLKEAAAYDRR